MDSEIKFENKLINLIEKYGRKPLLEVDNNDPESNEYSESEQIEDNYDFHYDKVINEGYAISQEMSISKSTGKHIFIIVFYNDEFSDNLRKIVKDADLYQTTPAISTDSLYYCINDLRIKYQQDEYHNDKIKIILDFIEELFEDRYSKIENMIKNGIIDFKSLWYYLDKVDSYYIVEKLKEKICFKYSFFTYNATLENCPLVLTGKVIIPQSEGLCLCTYDHFIKNFKGTKKIDTLKIKEFGEDDSTFIEYGNKILEWYDSFEYMHMKGKYYRVSGDSIVCHQKNERVMIDYKGMDKYSNSPFEYPIEGVLDDHNIAEDDKKIFFPFVSVYNLGINKRWGVTHINNLNDIKFQTDAFDYLVLEQEKKDTIKCLIRNMDDENKYIDFISDKGNGLVILLYGEPGTGKTLTAEATCEYLKKPLYSVNIGDLGTNPETMENIMNQILDYIKRWDAIMMIDECDIFLEERERNMITRNAMVGIFLKLLEYHSGIIFLTTNRLTTLDPAVKSRINLTLSYGQLTESKRKLIWESLFKKWNISLKKSTINKLSHHKLNGREIRNYIKLVFSILKDKELDINDSNILKTLDSCFKLTNEFNESLKESSLYL